MTDADSGSPAPPPRALRRLVAYARPYAALLGGALLVSVAAASGKYLRAWLVEPILDDVLLPQRAGVDVAALGDRFAEIAALALLLVLAVPAAQLGRSYLVAWCLGRIHVDVQRDLCAALLALPLRFHRDRRRGDVLSRAQNDVAYAQHALTLLLDELLAAAVMLAVGIGALLLVSWQLTLVSLAAGPVLFGVIALFGRRIRAGARRRQEKVGDITQRLVEILSGIKVIQAFRAEAAEAEGFRRETEKLFRRSLRVVLKRLAARNLVEALNQAVAAGTLLLGVWLVLGGRWGLTPGSLAAYAFVSATAYRPLKALAKGWSQLVDAGAAAERFTELLDAPARARAGDRAAPGRVALDCVRRGVRFADVSFSYGREPVLRGVSFEARAGEVVAIVGRTGAGKTTLTDLLLGFYEPDAGAIEIDGVDLREIRRDAWLERVAVVGQEPFLFDGSIRDNIRYGRPAATDAEVRAAAEIAHVDEFAARLPAGFDTPVGAEGLRLSGGQRQRVTLARALLRDPDVLVLDEATSALDGESERLVQDATLALLAGRTVFVVAHRLSTIRRADRIVVLDRGRVAQVGCHADLATATGPYRDFIAA